MKRMCAIGMAVLLVWLGLCRISASAEETEIPAAAYVLMEAETGTVLLESNSDAPFSCWRLVLAVMWHPLSWR